MWASFMALSSGSFFFRDANKDTKIAQDTSIYQSAFLLL